MRSSTRGRLSPVPFEGVQGSLGVPLLGEGSPTNIDYRTKGTLILTSLLDLGAAQS